MTTPTNSAIRTPEEIALEITEQYLTKWRFNMGIPSGESRLREAIARNIRAERARRSVPSKSFEGSILNLEVYFEAYDFDNGKNYEIGCVEQLRQPSVKIHFRSWIKPDDIEKINELFGKKKTYDLELKDRICVDGAKGRRENLSNHSQ